MFEVTLLLDILHLLKELAIQFFRHGSWGAFKAFAFINATFKV